MKKCSALSVGVFTLLLSAGIASASTITIETDPGTTWEVDNIAQWHTTGNTMDGIFITASFTNNGNSFTETSSWTDGSGASGTGWSLTMNNYDLNTWDAGALWTLEADSGYSITGLIIDGKPGDTVFDIDFSPEGTPDSESGQEIWEPDYMNPNLTVKAKYTNLVTVQGSPSPVGDLYDTLSLVFDGTGLSSANPFTFSLDTDNVNAPVPEPATMLLFGAGLVGLAGVRRLKKK